MFFGFPFTSIFFAVVFSFGVSVYCSWFYCFQVSVLMPIMNTVKYSFSIGYYQLLSFYMPHLRNGDYYPFHVMVSISINVGFIS